MENTLLASGLLADELIGAPPAVSEVLSALSQDCVEPVVRSEEAYYLQERYLAAGVVGQSSEDDALHVALATVAGADVIVELEFQAYCASGQDQEVQRDKCARRVSFD